MANNLINHISIIKTAVKKKSLDMRDFLPGEHTDVLAGRDSRSQERRAESSFPDLTLRDLLPAAPPLYLFVMKPYV